MIDLIGVQHIVLTICGSKMLGAPAYLSKTLANWWHMSLLLKQTFDKRLVIYLFGS